jgi:membrane protein DedA with SNARE-associated domain
MNAAPAAPPVARSLGIAFIWGLAESTFFFLVPDVWTSRLALSDLRLALKACLTSLGGALLGGTVLYSLGTSPELTASLLTTFERLPGISPALSASAEVSLQHQGALALFSGMFTGTPYKLYALQASSSSVGIGIFLLVSVGARLSRFLVVTFLAWGLARLALAKYGDETRLRIHLGIWLIFYVAYFWRMRG